MEFLRKIGRLFAEYFVFSVGFLFVFFVGFLYAIFRIEGFFLNLVFFVIVVGWVIFLIRYFWDLLEKKRKLP